MQVTTKMARTMIETFIDYDTPVMIAGAPGIGKSDIVRQIANDRGIGFIPLLLSTMESVDLRGLPHIENGKAIFAQCGELPDENRDGKEGIVFFDELPQSSQSMQVAAMPLILDRRLGDYRIPAGWRVVAAGNRQEDRAGANRMNSALANRLAHIDVSLDVDDWCKWALLNGMPAELVAFIRFRPALLHSFNPDEKINATPRSWARAAKHVGKGLPHDLETACIAANVGDGPAAEFMAFLRIWRQLPNPDAVLMNPDTSDIPTDGATLYALCGALARKVTIRTIGNFVKYISRMPAEYGVLAVKDATRRDQSLTKTPEMVTFLALNSDVYL